MKPVLDLYRILTLVRRGLSVTPANLGMMNDAQHHQAMLGFKAPNWATDWCPHCGWEAKCGACRAWMD